MKLNDLIKFNNVEYPLHLEDIDALILKKESVKAKSKISVDDADIHEIYDEELLE